MDEARDLLSVERYGKKAETYKISEIIAQEEKDNFGHGGGDLGIVRAYYELLNGKGTADTSLERSAESHFIAYAAEESRKSGAAVKIGR